MYKRQVFPEADIGVYTVLIAEGVLGAVGKAVFALLLAFACFTTSVGLTSTAGDVFQEMSGGKLQYKAIVAVSSVVGFGIGTIGLGKIVGYTVPWLMLVYPAIIVLLVGSLFDFDKFKPALQGAIVTAVILSIGDFLGAMGMADNPFSSLTAKPVSYTHLDVYKRQGVDDGQVAGPVPLLEEDIVTGLEGGAGRGQEDEGRPEAAAPAPGGVKSEGKKEQ